LEAWTALRVVFVISSTVALAKPAPGKAQQKPTSKSGPSFTSFKQFYIRTSSFSSNATEAQGKEGFRDSPP
jgi:hypothetical protein